MSNPMVQINALRERLPEAAKDMRLNLQTVLSESSLSEEQVWGVAASCAIASRNADLIRAVLEDAAASASPATLEDARAAAVIMGMNNVYYRFRHMIGKEDYSTRPARLRMNYLARPQSSKADFELYCLAVSAINGCESCVRSHEQTVLGAGLSMDQVHDAVRIASVMHATAIALEM